MAWLQLNLDTDQQTADEVSDLLTQFGAMAVSLSALSRENVFDRDSTQANGLWIETRISALLYEDTDLDILLPLLRQRIGEKHIRNYSIEYLADRDWVGESRQGYQARVFSDRLCICPDWQEPPGNVEHILWLEPGLAFGTGSHETTRLCLEWLVQQTLENKIVVDYGCGSGILALSALMLGASQVYATDIDSQALVATAANADKNCLTANLTSGFPDNIQLPETDILLANILLNPLKSLAPVFSGIVRKDGQVVLSGLLANQVDDCLAAYATWFNMDPPVFDHEWALLTGVRK